MLRKLQRKWKEVFCQDCIGEQDKAEYTVFVR